MYHVQTSLWRDMTKPNIRQEQEKQTKQFITNMLAPPIDKVLYIYLFCLQSEHQNKSIPI
jgi:hypothetical protein